MNDRPLLIKQQMGLRKLAKQFRSIADATSSKRILVTSVQRGDGKAKFINELHAELTKMNEPTFVAIEAEKLHNLSPHKYGKEIVVVYGPAYMESFGLHMLPEKWLNAFDAAVVIVMVRSTTSKELIEMLDWLKEYGIEQIWLVWNEHFAPPTEMIWPRLMRRLGMTKAVSDRKNKLATVIERLRDSWAPARKKSRLPKLVPAEEKASNPVHVKERGKNSEPGSVSMQAPANEEQAANSQPAPLDVSSPPMNAKRHNDSTPPPVDKSTPPSYVTSSVHEPAFIKDPHFSTGSVAISKTVSVNHTGKTIDPRATLSIEPHLLASASDGSPSSVSPKKADPSSGASEEVGSASEPPDDSNGIPESPTEEDSP